MSEQNPTYQDADLVLRIYDMRREAKMRASRHAINFGFCPKSYEDCKAIGDPGHEQNEAWRQVTSYWEMVYGMAKHGIVHADYWVENNGEGIFVFAKIAPHLAEIRKNGSPTAFQHVEWAATQTETGKQIFAFLSRRVKARLESQ